MRNDLIDPTIAIHNGRLVKRTGDGAVVEFRSVVEAVRSAIEVQAGIAERNAGLPADNRIEVRVGIHLGDVVEEADGDLMGDGVNIPSRLEGMAKPGGICLSQGAYEQVRDKVKEEFDNLGEQNLKNIARPMRVMRSSRSRSLEGSVQRRGDRIRVNVQLVDAGSGNHLWAEQFDKPVADFFDMQYEIVARLANELDSELVFEARRLD